MKWCWSGAYLIGYLLLFLPREIDKVVVLCPHQKGDCRFVETAPLTVPLLDGVQRAFAGEVEHEENGNGIVADERQHVDELALASQIPYRECDLCVPD